MKQRIWELDAFRGVCIVGMVLMHILFDLSALFGITQIHHHPVFRFVAAYGGIFFVLLSGICVTFCRSSVRRGLFVFFFGLTCTAVTAAMYWLQLADKSIVIYFGALHCLGVCMLLWPLCKHLPNWILAIGGIVLVVAGYYLIANVRVQSPYLFALGLMRSDFVTSDYFPLLPNAGYFLLGAVLGRTVYKSRRSLLPTVNAEHFLLRFFRFCGRHSLWIYLVHQPVLTGFISLWMFLKN